MPPLSTHHEVAVLTSAGRRAVEERLERAESELGQIDERVRAGRAAEEEIEARVRLENHVEELRRVLTAAADVGEVQEDPTIVEVGDEVDVDEGDGELATYAVVHPAEASADENRVSAESPLGRALLGARVGDRVTVEAPAGAYHCTVRARRRLA